MRDSFELNVLRDRAPLFVTLSDGSIRNGYTLKVLNKDRTERHYRLQVAGIPDAKLTVVGHEGAETGNIQIEAKPDSVASFRVYVAAPRHAVRAESSPMTFTVRETQGGETATYTSVFMGPR
jgi:polyferredoxin